MRTQDHVQDMPIGDWPPFSLCTVLAMYRSSRFGHFVRCGVLQHGIYRRYTRVLASLQGGSHDKNKD